MGGMGGEIEGVDSPPVVSMVDDVVVVVVDDRGKVLAAPTAPTAIVLGGVWSSSGLTQCDVVFSSSITLHIQQKGKWI